jgi:predicted Zn finger-like uncharacterized protein
MATADPKFTRCPGCQTVFRVTAEQLALRGGQVRCGHCRTVFDGNAQALSLAPRSRAEAELDDDFVRGPATVTLRNSHALEAAPQPPAASTPPAYREPVFAPLPAESGAVAAQAGVAPDTGPKAQASLDDAAGTQADVASPTEAPAAPEAAPPTGAATARPWSSRRALYAAAIPLLLVLFAAQAVLHFRDAIAARWPGTKPTLVRLCDTLGCQIRPLHDIAVLSIDASDLQADPAHKGLLVLTATIRNRAAVPLAFPMLELTLTDASDTVVLRRALNPAEYAGGTANLGAGIQANSEVLVKMFIDASATTQAGYRLYLFYP